MIKLLKNVANLNNNFQITVTYQLQFLLYDFSPVFASLFIQFKQILQNMT